MLVNCTMCMYSDDDFFDFKMTPLEGERNDDVDPPNCQHPTSESWHRSTKTRKTKELREALTLQNQIEAASTQLKELTSASASENAVKISELATQIASSAAGLSRFWSQISATHLYNEQRAEAGAARRVFDVPELLERILSFLSEKELLIVQRVDRTMYDAIEGSIILSRKLHLCPNATGFLETPFAKPRKRRRCSCGPRYPSRLLFPGFKCYSSSRPPRYCLDEEDILQEDDYYQYRTIVADVQSPIGSEKRTLGARCRKMLICQPPVTKMQVYPHCCGYQYYEQDFVFGNHPPWPPAPFPPPQALPLPPPPPPAPPGPPHTAIPAGVFANPYGPVHPPPPMIQPVPPRPDVVPVFNKTGITIGDLYDAADKLKESHRLCPFASASHHDMDGNVRATVTFACLVKLKEDDPTVKPYKPFKMDDFPPLAPVSPSSYVSFSETLNRYIGAKREAHSDGRPIPTYEEFKASEGVEGSNGEPSSPARQELDLAFS